MNWIKRLVGMKPVKWKVPEFEEGEESYAEYQNLHYTEMVKSLSNLLSLPPKSPPADPLSANVYADWLEENNYPEAAAALRKAFPLSADTDTEKKDER